MRCRARPRPRHARLGKIPSCELLIETRRLLVRDRIGTSFVLWVGRLGAQRVSHLVRCVRRHDARGAHVSDGDAKSLRHLRLVTSLWTWRFTPKNRAVRRCFGHCAAARARGWVHRIRQCKQDRFERPGLIDAGVRWRGAKSGCLIGFAFALLVFLLHWPCSTGARVVSLECRPIVNGDGRRRRSVRRWDNLRLGGVVVRSWRARVHESRKERRRRHHARQRDSTVAAAADGAPPRARPPLRPPGAAEAPAPCGGGGTPSA